ncbi:MAG: hypothetical protein AAFX81_04240 [Pseudomonadota bacterium]
MDGWGWLITFEVFIMFGIAFGLAWRELRELDRLRAEREAAERETRP